VQGYVLPLTMAVRTPGNGMIPRSYEHGCRDIVPTLLLLQPVRAGRGKWSRQREQVSIVHKHLTGRKTQRTQYQLQGRILLEVTLAQFVKSFSNVYGSRRTMTLFTMDPDLTMMDPVQVHGAV
jgi:hypothetical protein